MDTSETYIKMCEKVEEIQEQWCGSRGDYYAKRYKNKNISRVRFYPYTLGIRPRRGIWLPRQDQLQEMVGLNQHNVVTIFPALADFHFHNMYEAIEDEHLTADKGTRLTDWHQRQFKSIRHFRHTFTSMEQLWLAFVMKEKYDQMWDGEEWVKKE